MTWDEEVSLISEVQEYDDVGYPVGDPKETKREVFANKKSVVRTEFYAANQSDMKADVVFEIHLFEYGGERFLSHEGKRYEVIRTYEASKELIELTCSDLSQGV